MIGAVLFDFDGTLLDSKPLVTEILAEFAASRFGVRAEPEEYARYVGPPMSATMAELGAIDVPAAVAAYRELYNTRMLESALFPGVEEMLETLAARLPLGVATSKRQDATHAILDHHRIAHLFTTIRGENEQLRSKAAVIAAALDDLGEVRGDVIMVGDRIFDIEGARASGLRTIAVTWGTGTPDEYAEALTTVDTVAELTDAILSRIDN